MLRFSKNSVTGNVLICTAAPHCSATTYIENAGFTLYAGFSGFLTHAILSETIEGEYSSDDVEVIKRDSATPHPPAVVSRRDVHGKGNISVPRGDFGDEILFPSTNATLSPPPGKDYIYPEGTFSSSENWTFNDSQKVLLIGVSMKWSRSFT